MLANRAQWDESKEVRDMALSRLTDATLLSKVASGTGDPEIREAARKRLREAIAPDDGSIRRS
jgi:hypothetical protein